MTSVAFFRNLNQGQTGHPSTTQIVEAFESIGASGVRPVRSNGTVIFEHGEPQTAIAGVLSQLHGAGAWSDLAFARDEHWLADRVDELAAAGDVQFVELSLFDGELSHELPMRGKGCTVVRAGSGYAITVNDTPGTSQATPTLERALGTPVTSRGASTVYLVLDRS